MPKDSHVWFQVNDIKKNTSKTQKTQTADWGSLRWKKYHLIKNGWDYNKNHCSFLFLSYIAPFSHKRYTRWLSVSCTVCAAAAHIRFLSKRTWNNNMHVTNRHSQKTGRYLLASASEAEQNNKRSASSTTPMNTYYYKDKSVLKRCNSWRRMYAKKRRMIYTAHKIKIKIFRKVHIYQCSLSESIVCNSRWRIYRYRDRLYT